MTRARRGGRESVAAAALLLLFALDDERPRSGKRSLHAAGRLHWPERGIVDRLRRGPPRRARPAPQRAARARAALVVV